MFSFRPRQQYRVVLRPLPPESWLKSMGGTIRSPLETHPLGAHPPSALDLDLARAWDPKRSSPRSLAQAQSLPESLKPWQSSRLTETWKSLPLGFFWKKYIMQKGAKWSWTFLGFLVIFFVSKLGYKSWVESSSLQVFLVFISFIMT